MNGRGLGPPNKPAYRIALLLAGCVILILVYLFQQVSVAALLGVSQPDAVFAVNRVLRMVLNDFACFLIIIATFQEAKYLKVAFFIFLLELLIILPVYLAIKLTLEGDSEISSPLLSHVHRLIVNPMLMLLLIAGFAYQRFAHRTNAN